MVFSSLIFLYGFLPLCVAVYFVMPTLRAKNLVLTLLSLLFYAWGEPVWVVLLIFSAATDYINGLLIEKYRGGRRAKAALVFSLILNLGLLGTFKYLDFFLGSLGWLFRAPFPQTSLLLPIGISFYTFQTLSYTIDVYRDKVPVQHSFMDFLLFVSLFPQLIAGPILRYAEIAPQLSQRRSTWEGVSAGLSRFLVGLGKKVLIANYCGRTVETLWAGELASLTVLEAWLGLFCFAFQIYFDFSGYSDMAIGLGRVFGFSYGENFRYPYISLSVTDFWRRWHISLGSFFRDYVYIPLGGNRRHQLRNLLLVWFLTGLWHGASWNFALWGLYFAFWLCLEKFVLRSQLEKIKKAAWIYAFLVTQLGWVLFYFTDLSTAVRMYGLLFGAGQAGLVNERALVLLQNNAPLLLLAFLAATPLAKGLWTRISARPSVRFGLICAGDACLLLLCTVLLVGASYNPFLYFRF